MKIAVIGANGKAGKLIVQEALSRGLDVTAISRGENKTLTNQFIQKDLFKLTFKDIESFDVIIDAFGTWSKDSLVLHSESLQYLADLLANTNKRLVVVGGAGSLYMDQSHTVRLVDTADFPEAYKDLALAMATSFDELRKRSDVQWTYISPAADFRAEGERTGKYVLAGEEFTVNQHGNSIISYADYAIALVDEVLEGKNLQKRISVYSQDAE